MSIRTKILGFLNSSAPKDYVDNDATPDHASQEIRGEVRDMVNRFTKTVREKDLPTLVRLMTDDVVLLTPSGAPIIGRDAVEALSGRIFNKFNIREHTDFAVKTSEERTPAVVHAFAFVALTAVSVGTVIEMRGSVVGVLRYENGEWKSPDS